MAFLFLTNLRRIRVADTTRLLRFQDLNTRDPDEIGQCDWHALHVFETIELSHQGVGFLYQRALTRACHFRYRWPCKRGRGLLYTHSKGAFHIQLHRLWYR